MKEYINTVIIPTMCKIERKQSLLNAIKSINQQEGVNSKIVVVVNGSVFDPELVQMIKNIADTELVFLETANLALAIEHGSSLVESKYFSFLDDDDVYINNTLKIRINALEAETNIDVLVTNGYDVCHGQQRLRVKTADAVNQDPLLALMNYNWLASSGGTFRSATVSEKYFHRLVKYYEWTTIAFRVSDDLKLRFVDTPTFCINDSAVSLSKSPEFTFASEDILRMMLSNDKSKKIKRLLNSKLSSVLHTLSDVHRNNNELTSAWRYHVQSLFYTGGYRYISYTRRLFYALFKPVSSS